MTEESAPWLRARRWHERPATGVAQSVAQPSANLGKRPDHGGGHGGCVVVRRLSESGPVRFGNGFRSRARPFAGAAQRIFAIRQRQSGCLRHPRLSAHPAHDRVGFGIGGHVGDSHTDPDPGRHCRLLRYRRVAHGVGARQRAGRPGSFAALGRPRPSAGGQADGADRQQPQCGGIGQRCCQNPGAVPIRWRPQLHGRRCGERAIAAGPGRLDWACANRGRQADRTADGHGCRRAQCRSFAGAGGGAAGRSGVGRCLCGLAFGSGTAAAVWGGGADGDGDPAAVEEQRADWGGAPAAATVVSIRSERAAADGSRFRRSAAAVPADR